MRDVLVSQVPMPVVTIEPAKVNTIPYENGQEDTIEFTITNHGLIRADNVRFVLPEEHPYLNFESVSPEPSSNINHCTLSALY